VILDWIWGMRRKRKIGTGLVSKYKARLNADSRHQEYGVNYWETFVPVVAWTTIKLIVSLSIIHNWHTKQIDFVLSYLQAYAKGETYMRLLKRFKLDQNWNHKGIKID